MQASNSAKAINFLNLISIKNLCNGVKNIVFHKNTQIPDIHYKKVNKCMEKTRTARIHTEESLLW